MTTKRHKGRAVKGDKCSDCGFPLSEQERIIEIWSTIFGEMIGKRHWDYRTCEKNLRGVKK